MRQARWLQLGLILACEAAASAQIPSRTLDRCMTIADSAARLSCYDNALARPVPRIAPGEPPRMPTPSTIIAPPVARQARPQTASAPSQIEARITAIVPVGDDLFRFQLSDGTVWRTGEQARIRPRVGEMVRVRRSMLTYYAAIDGRAAIGVRPVR